MNNSDRLYNEHIVIEGWMRGVLDLKGNELLLFALIFGFSQDGDSYFYGRRSYMKNWLGVSLPTVDSACQSLLDKNLIIKETNTINGMIYNKYKVNLELINEVLKNFIGCKEILYPCKKTLHIDNINNNLDIKERKYKKKEKDEEKLEKARLLLNHWNSKKIIVHKDTLSLLQDIVKIKDNNCKDYTYDSICMFIDRYATILNDKSYFFEYKWSLKDFLKQKNAMPTFAEDGSKWNDYLNRKKTTNYGSKQVKDVPDWYDEYIDEVDKKIENQQNNENKELSQQELEELFRTKK